MSHASEHSGIDAIEEELILAHVPEGLRARCDAAEVPETEVFIRSVSCRSPVVGNVQFSRAHGGDDLRAYFVARGERHRIRWPPSTASTCRSSDKAAGEWIRPEGNEVGHREQPSRRAGGRVLCYTEGSRWHLGWTDTATKLFTSASVDYPRRHRLYTWWSVRAGPEAERAHHDDHELGDFPDEMEDELLLDHIPDEVRHDGGCSRTTAPDANVFLRTVRCHVGSGTVDYAYAHSGTALRQHFHRQVGDHAFTLESESQCRRRGTGVGTWRAVGDAKVETRSRNATGGFLCHETAGRAYIEWFSVPESIYAVASRPRSRQHDLYTWWLAHAGPVEHGHEEGGTHEGAGMEEGGHG